MNSSSPTRPASSGHPSQRNPSSRSRRRCQPRSPDELATSQTRTGLTGQQQPERAGAALEARMRSVGRQLRLISELFALHRRPNGHRTADRRRHLWRPRWWLHLLLAGWLA